MKVLLTGATGGIGRHVLKRLKELNHETIVVSRHGQHQATGSVSLSSEKDGSCIVPCDLTKETPDLAGNNKVDVLVHMATTYKFNQDMLILERLITLAKTERIRRFIFLSSWVVHFPQNTLLHAEYIKMKRAAEARLLEEEEHKMEVVILRPSVVLGEGLQWTGVLQKLAPVSSILPLGWSRSFVSVEDVVARIEDAIEANKQISYTDRCITVLGERKTLSEAARQANPSGARHGLVVIRVLELLVAIWFFAVGHVALGLPFTQALASVIVFYVCGYLFLESLPFVASFVSDYLAGFYVTKFHPTEERDLLALGHATNPHIQVRGFDNAQRYFHRPKISSKTTISTKCFRRVLKCNDGMTVRVEAGMHFANLLSFLEQHHNKWLENYPNYHYITVGACIATPVHGSSLTTPFVADLVERICYYDRQTNQVLEVDVMNGAFSEMLFEPDLTKIILWVDIRVCDRPKYRLTTKRHTADDCLKFEPPSNNKKREEQERTTTSDRRRYEHYEVRIHSSGSKYAWLQSYEVIRDDDDDGKSNNEPSSVGNDRLLAFKFDSIGGMWNLMESNWIIGMLGQIMASITLNYEWFFSDDEQFQEFWSEIRSEPQKYRMFKLLVRHNRAGMAKNGAALIPTTKYHETISIDIAVWNTPAMRKISRELFLKYKPMEHKGKFTVSDLCETRMMGV